MHRCVRIAPFVLAALLLAPGLSEAGAVYGPGVGLHLAPAAPNSKNPCGAHGLSQIEDAVSHTSILSTPDGPFYYVYVLGCNYGTQGDGLSAIEFGIDYDGGVNINGGEQPICVFSWTRCALLEFPIGGWPAPGGGNRIFWDSPECASPQSGFVFKVAGFFYMGAYTNSTISVVANQTSNMVLVETCNATPIDVTLSGFFSRFQGSVGFGNQFGWPACLGVPLPVEPTTWSRVKSLGTD
jgi:hypothetical protein